ncbi:hypothetical protein EVA_16278 [gut metagenome]|uniref:DUF551 domain-containing protein n=1 Tax=gut metagenome TaxID=749906 RepID=J9FL33_9ZZZZ
MNKLTLEAAAGVYSGTVHDAKPYPIHIERNKAFKTGAEWQRNHVWHKPTEQPEESKLVLTLTSYGAFIFGPNHEDWEGAVDHFKIITWAYVDDLKPTPFDEILEANKEILKGSEE